MPAIMWLPKNSGEKKSFHLGFLCNGWEMVGDAGCNNWVLKNSI